MSKHMKERLAILGAACNGPPMTTSALSRARLSRYICSLSCATVWTTRTTS